MNDVLVRNLAAKGKDLFGAFHYAELYRTLEGAWEFGHNQAATDAEYDVRRNAATGFLETTDKRVIDETLRRAKAAMVRMGIAVDENEGRLRALIMEAFMDGYYNTFYAPKKPAKKSKKEKSRADTGKAK